jgi:hypothetical protein
METIFINPKNNTKANARVRGKSPTISGQGTKKKKKSTTVNNSLVNYFGNSGSPVVRRTLNTFTTVQSSAGGAISLQTKNSDGVRSSPSWGNISQEFENYRVRRMTIRFTPSTVNATSSTGPYQGMVMVGRWAQLVTASQASLEQKSDTMYHSTLEEFEYSANFLGIKDLQEWVPVGTALAANQVYGLAYMTPASTSVLAVSSDIFSIRIQWEVEFKKAN